MSVIYKNITKIFSKLIFLLVNDKFVQKLIYFLNFLFYIFNPVSKNFSPETLKNFVSIMEYFFTYFFMFLIYQ